MTQDNQQLKLKHKIIIKGRIIAQTGLMIGGSSTALEIGGLDRQIVRHPITKLPYIPGSSLKGKMRSLFELKYGTLDRKGGPTQDPKHLAARLFGHIKMQGDSNAKQQPSRLIVRDGYLRNPQKFENTELLYAETKAENSISRITSEANPRFFERVPKGARFALELVLNVFEQDQDDLLKATFEALALLQDDYLGAAGSRGNGQVRVEIQNIFKRNCDYYRDSVGIDKVPKEDESIAIPAIFKKPEPKKS